MTFEEDEEELIRAYEKWRAREIDRQTKQLVNEFLKSMKITVLKGERHGSV